MPEDLPERRLEVGSRLHPQVIQQPATGALIRVGSLGLPSAPIERDEELALQAFPKWMLVGKRLDRADVLSMQAHAQAEVESILERLEAQLLEANAVGSDKGSVAEVVQSGASPQAESAVKQGERLLVTAAAGSGSSFRDEPAKARQIKFIGLEQ